MKTLNQLLIELNACEEAIEWVGDRNIEQAVLECTRGDWMLWLAAEIEIDHRKLTLAKGHCANTVRHLMKDERSINAADTAIAYGEGKATEEQLKDAYAAAAAYAYAVVAAYAADCAAADYAAAAYAAAAAADAAAAAKEENRKQIADICRKYIGQEIIDKVNELLK